MWNYLRNPEVVVNTLFIVTTTMHWAGAQSIRSWNDESGIFLRAGTAIHAVFENKNEHNETELPAKLKGQTPRAAGYHATKLSLSAAGNNNLPPLFPSRFGIDVPHGVLFNPHIFPPAGLNPQFQNNARGRTATLKLSLAQTTLVSIGHPWRHPARHQNKFSPT
jgi:hypothetical protein